MFLARVEGGERAEEVGGSTETRGEIGRAAGNEKNARSFIENEDEETGKKESTRARENSSDPLYLRREKFKKNWQSI